MLNRLINGSEGADRSRYIQVMEGARRNPLAGPRLTTRIDDILERL
jgi:hypothetical protein